jgi:sugar/nucleoside kinase (ribokinase family)
MSPKRRLDCLVAGDANLDLLLDGTVHLEPGTEKLASSMRLTLGGSSSITAHNLARLGAKTALAAVVGKDSFGSRVLHELKAGGVDTRWIRVSTRLHTGLTVWHSENQLRAGVTYPGSISAVTLADIPIEALHSARHFHVGAYFLLRGLHRSAKTLFRRAKSVGCTTSLDCNYDPSGAWDSGLLNALPYIDVFLPNEAELCCIAGVDEVEVAAKKLASQVSLIVVKCGARGVLVCHEGRLQTYKTNRTRAVDSTGAGDSFNAGFLAHFSKGAALERCVLAGMAAAERSLTAVGGTHAFRK